MPKNYKKTEAGIGIVPRTTTAADAKGEMDVTSADGKLNYHNGTSASPMVTEAHSASLTNKTLVVASNTVTTAASGNLAATELNAALSELQSDIDTRATSSALSSHTGASSGVHGVTGSVVGTSDSQSLTNKTIDADQNTISNIENADIKSGAAIDAAKIADGSVSNTEFQYLGSVTSDIQSQIDGKQASGSYITALTGDVTASGPGSASATIASNSVSNAKLAQMAAHTIKGNNTGSTGNALDLTATQVTAELNNFVGDSGSGGVKGLVPAPASGDAAASKYLKADGTWSTVTSGTASPLTTKGDLYTYSTTNDRLPVGTNGQVLTADSTQSTGLKWSSLIPTTQPILSDWTSYTPTFTGFGTVSTSQVYYRRVGQSMQIRGSFTSGTPSASDASISLPSGFSISTDIRSGSTYDLVGVAELNQSIAYKLDVIAKASDTVVRIDRTDGSSPGLNGNAGSDLIASGQILSFFCEVPITGWAANTTVAGVGIGAIATDWTSFSMTIGGTTTAPTKGTVSRDEARYRRVGDSMEIEYNYMQTASGSAGSGIYLFPIPGGFTADTAKMSVATSGDVVSAKCGDASVSFGGSSPPTSTSQAGVHLYNSTNLCISWPQGGVNANVRVASGAGDLSTGYVGYSFKALVPISGWVANSTVAANYPSSSAIASTNIDWSLLGNTGGLYTKTLAASTTFTFSNQTAGQTIVVRLTNTVSNYTVTWPTVKWSGGTAPTMTTGAKSDIYTFIFDGTDIYGRAIQNF